MEYMQRSDDHIKGYGTSGDLRLASVVKYQNTQCTFTTNIHSNVAGIGKSIPYPNHRHAGLLDDTEYLATGA